MSESDVIPEEELNRRRRVLALSEEVGEHARSLYAKLVEFHDLVPEPKDFLELIAHAVGSETLDKVVASFETGIKWFSDAVAAGKLPHGLLDSFFQGASATIRASHGHYHPPAPQQPSAIDMHAIRMYVTLERLFAEAPKLENPDGTPAADQRPAIECHVVLRTSGAQLYGSLSTAESGMLRMLTPAEKKMPSGRSKTILCEQFFDVSDIVSIMVEREVKTEGRSPIITSA